MQIPQPRVGFCVTDIVDRLEPRLGKWFRRKFSAPTQVQEEAVAHVLEGRSVLISSPTGTGKTLAAFLGVFDELSPRVEKTSRLPHGSTKKWEWRLHSGSCSYKRSRPSDGMADIRDLKSRGGKLPCGFDSRLGHLISLSRRPFNGGVPANNPGPRRLARGTAFPLGH